MENIFNLRVEWDGEMDKDLACRWTDLNWMHPHEKYQVAHFLRGLADQLDDSWKFDQIVEGLVDEV